MSLQFLIINSYCSGGLLFGWHFFKWQLIRSLLLATIEQQLLNHRETFWQPQTDCPFMLSLSRTCCTYANAPVLNASCRMQPIAK